MEKWAAKQHAPPHRPPAVLGEKARQITENLAPAHLDGVQGGGGKDPHSAPGGGNCFADWAAQRYFLNVAVEWGRQNHRGFGRQKSGPPHHFGFLGPGGRAFAERPWRTHAPPARQPPEAPPPR